MRTILLYFFAFIFLSSCHSPRDRKSRNATNKSVEKIVTERRQQQKKTIEANRKSNSSIMTGEEIYAKYNKAVFLIMGENGQGSAFFINDKGYAISNYHVFKDNDNVKAKLGDYAYEINEIYTDTNTDDDFVIFHVNTDEKNVFIPLAIARPKVGQKVYAIGSPKGLENTFSSGEISQMKYYDNENMIQINVPIDHGSSGGALINEKGEVVGITTAGYDNSNANLNFALSIEVVKPYLSIK